MAPLALLAALWFLLRLSLWQTILRLLPVALVSLLLLLPWVARNFALYAAFVPISTTSGANLWQGNNAQTVATLRAGYDAQWIIGPQLEEQLDAPARNAALSALALDWLRANPALLPELWWVKLLTHWSIDVTPLRKSRSGELPPEIRFLPTPRRSSTNSGARCIASTGAACCCWPWPVWH